jgi:uncharacterized protein YbaR (Trm112 family)
MNNVFLKNLVCPYDHAKVNFVNKSSTKKFYECELCHRQYPIIKETPNFLPDGLREWTLRQNHKINLFTVVPGQWKPGFRGWHPSFLTRILSFGFGYGRPEKNNNVIVLDVGCGDDPKGDVNVDIYIPSLIPNNFILASAELLPFKNNSFDIVRSAYVIEHNLSPIEMIKEHFRVCSKKVEIYTDNSDWFGIIIYRILNIGSIFHDEHYFKWSKEYFINILNRLGLKGKVIVFNLSPSFLIKMTSLFGKLPRIGNIFYRDLYVEIYKK